MRGGLGRRCTPFEEASTRGKGGGGGGPPAGGVGVGVEGAGSKQTAGGGTQLSPNGRGPIIVSRWGGGGGQWSPCTPLPLGVPPTPPPAISHSQGSGVWRMLTTPSDVPPASPHWGHSVNRSPGAPPPRVTFRRVVVPLQGPGRSPVLPFACCVGSLCSVGRCGRCSCWCRFRVHGAQSLVYRGLCWLLRDVPRVRQRRPIIGLWASPFGPSIQNCTVPERNVLLGFWDGWVAIEAPAPRCSPNDWYAPPEVPPSRPTQGGCRACGGLGVPCPTRGPPP